MRQGIVVAATLAAAVAFSQILDRDPIPAGVIPLLWISSALAVIVEIVGVAALKRAASVRPLLAAALLMTMAGSLAALPFVAMPRLSAIRPERAVWASVETTEPRLALLPGAREFAQSLKEAAGTSDLAACQRFLEPGDGLGPRTLLPIGELIASPRVVVTPVLLRFTTAVRAMERVAIFRQVNRTPPSSVAERRLVLAYDAFLMRPWVLTRELRTSAGAPIPSRPSMCIYGLVNFDTKFVQEFTTLLDAVPAS